MKELKVEIPKGYEIDKENSTFECIKFKPKDVCEFSPFDRVLVRDNNSARWKPKLFAFHNVDYDKDYPFETTDGGFFRYCISYNEDLANTTKNI